MSLAWHFGEPSVEAVENWPAHQVDQWRRFGRVIGGMEPLTARQAVYVQWRIALWQGSLAKDPGPLEFNDLFLPDYGKEPAKEEQEDQSPEEIVSVLKAFARVQSAKQNRNCDNGG